MTPDDASGEWNDLQNKDAVLGSYGVLYKIFSEDWRIRTVRRKDREITDFHQMEKIIADAGYLHLGMFDDGYPYVVPLHYGYLAEEGKLTFYAHSAKEKCHALQLLMKTQTGEAHIITEKMADQVTIIRIDVTSYSGKACKRS